MADDLVVVYQAQDQGEASAIKLLLESENIPLVLLDERSTWGGYAQFVHPEYYAKIAVPERFALRSRHILDKVDTGTRTTRRESRNVRFSATSYRVCSALAAVVCGVTIWLVRQYGYLTGFWIFGAYMLGAGIANFGYVKPAPYAFKRMVFIFCVAHFPIGTALVLVAFDTIGRIHFPTVAFTGLSLVSALGFAYAALGIRVEEPNGQS